MSIPVTQTLVTMTGNPFRRVAMHDTDVDLSTRDLHIRGRLVVSASSELVRGHYDLDELVETIEHSFADGRPWCEVGHELHTISNGEGEIRLTPLLENWHADFFDAGWNSDGYAQVPAQSRPPVAAYVDAVHGLKPGLVQEMDLREAAADGGARAVDRLVRRQLGLLDARFDALDQLHGCLTGPTGRLPGWGQAFIRLEAEDLNAARENLSSAVLAFHHGSAGRRPDTLWGGIWFPFSTGAVNLVDDANEEPAGPPSENANRSQGRAAV